MTSKINSQTAGSLGNLIQLSSTTQEWIGETSLGWFKITVFNDLIFKISISKTNFFEDFSYSVIVRPSPTLASFTETDERFSITTGSIKLVVTKSPVRFSFQTLQGESINEDDPGLGTSWIGEQVTTYKKLQDGERFIGLGEKTGNLDRKGSSYTNWNTDAYGYHSGSDPLYCSTPFYIGIHHQKNYGVFLDNSHKTHFNFGASNNRFSSFAADAGEMNYYFIGGTSIADIIKEYTWLTGRMDLPPQWSIGYQQCRYSYYPDKEVLNVARTFREKEIPADVIVLDIHYMDKYKIFTWDKKNFADPKGMIDQLKAMGFEVVIMCDPGIKVEPGYQPYEDGVKNDVFIKFPDGENYQGQVWPGWCLFPDFTKPESRQWWAELFKDYVALGVEGFWNDMNEIATWGHALPENLEFDFDGNKATTRRGRNLYGFQMARSTYEGTKKLLGGKRPFNLTRSAFSGIQRYAAVWTGDNVSYEEHMMLGVRLVNSLGLTGVAFAGYDTGGFVGDANTKLFARWISIASFSPFFRAHTMINTRDSEPWSYGEEVEQISRNFIRLRYQLMPYLYSLFFDAHKTGMPVQRSLAIPYPHDSRVFDHQYQHQYLFGPFFLIAPVESSKELVKVFLPEGTWYYLYTGKVYQGNQELILECPIHRLPVFVKGGAIVPAQKPVINTKEQADELILHIYAGTEYQTFSLYRDDGSTFQYEKGFSMSRTLEYFGNERKIQIGQAAGNFVSGYKTLNLIFHGWSEDQVNVNEQEVALQSHHHSFFTPLEKYDPINDPESMGEEWVKSAKIQYSDNPIQITW